MEWLKQQGPWCPALDRLPAPPPPAVRRPDLLHLSLRADRARPRGRAAAQHPRLDRARRAGDPPGDLQGRLRASRPRSATSPTASAHSSQLQFPDRPLLEEMVGVGVDLPQQQPYPRMPAPPRRRAGPSTAGRRRDRAATTATTRPRRATSRRISWRAAPSSAAATGSTARSRCTAAASIRARAARS